jgi:hypothetical protein
MPFIVKKKNTGRTPANGYHQVKPDLNDKTRKMRVLMS